MSIEDSKAVNLMSQLWAGESSLFCKGSMYGYSNMSFILFKPAELHIGHDPSFLDISTNEFLPSFDDHYNFQFIHRFSSIKYNFIREFFICLVMLAVFQFINIEYLYLFKGKITYIELRMDDRTGVLSTVSNNFILDANTNDFGEQVLYPVILSILFKYISYIAR